MSTVVIVVHWYPRGFARGPACLATFRAPTWRRGDRTLRVRCPKCDQIKADTGGDFRKVDLPPLDGR